MKVSELLGLMTGENGDLTVALVAGDDDYVAVERVDVVTTTDEEGNEVKLFAIYPIDDDSDDEEEELEDALAEAAEEDAATASATAENGVSDTPEAQ